MVVQNMQTALLKKDLRVAKGLHEGEETNDQLSMENKIYKKEIKGLQVENQDLKLNIISLKDTIEDLKLKKKKLSDSVQKKEQSLKSLEKEKLGIEAQIAG
jgi:predicted RNase H-like nuclease (RuvC/YqgF family)